MKKYIVILLVVFLLLSCTIQQKKVEENNQTKDITSKKTLVNESSLIKNKSVSDEKNDCEENLKELEEKIEGMKYNLLKYDSNITKISKVMQHLKDANGKEKEYEDALRELQLLSGKRKELSSEMALNDDALEILKSKCGPKSKLKDIKKTGW